MKPLQIFVGYDPAETVAYHVLCHSIIRHASRPVSITPIALGTLHGVFNRDRHPLQSTEFSFSRFLVPFLSNYEGFSLFMDCDMLVRTDIAELFEMAYGFRDRWSIACVPHNHMPEHETKFLGAKQTKYVRKNWSSVVMFNNAECKILKPYTVETADGLWLHQFQWCPIEHFRWLPKRWNFLVGTDIAESPEEISNFHFTEGGPWFDDYKNAPYASLWLEELKLANAARQVVK